MATSSNPFQGIIPSDYTVREWDVNNNEVIIKLTYGVNDIIISTKDDRIFSFLEGKEGARKEDAIKWFKSLSNKLTAELTCVAGAFVTCNQEHKVVKIDVTKGDRVKHIIYEKGFLGSKRTATETANADAAELTPSPDNPNWNPGRISRDINNPRVYSTKYTNPQLRSPPFSDEQEAHLLKYLRDLKNTEGSVRLANLLAFEDRETRKDGLTNLLNLENKAVARAIVEALPPSHDIVIQYNQKAQ